jgi:hypothetical protein
MPIVELSTLLGVAHIVAIGRKSDVGLSRLRTPPGTLPVLRLGTRFAAIAAEDILGKSNWGLPDSGRLP